VNKRRIKERKLKIGAKTNSPQRNLSPWQEVFTECHHLARTTTTEKARFRHSEGKASRRARSSSRDHVSEDQSSPWQENLSWRDKALWNTEG